MNNKIALVLYASVLSVSCALAQDAGLITHGAEVVEVQGLSQPLGVGTAQHAGVGVVQQAIAHHWPIKDPGRTAVRAADVGIGVADHKIVQAVAIQVADGNRRGGTQRARAVGGPSPKAAEVAVERIRERLGMKAPEAATGG